MIDFLKAKHLYQMIHYETEVSDHERMGKNEPNGKAI